MGKKKRKREYWGEPRRKNGNSPLRQLMIAVARKLYRLYGCDVHLGMQGGTMLVYWSLIRCKPEFSGRFYKDAFRAFMENRSPTTCRKQEPTYPPLGVWVPGPIKANIPRKAPPVWESYGDPFLESYEWRKLRLVVLKRYGAKCQCCGASAKDGVTINVDHIKPRKTHPDLALDIDNLQVLCNLCNHGKGNWDSTDWRREDSPDPEKLN